MSKKKQMELNKIKERIKALLSKTTDNGATKEEMDSALTKANQLMRDFFITEHDLKDPTIINKCISKKFKLTKSGFDLSLFYNELSELFDCQYYFNKNDITFFGYEQDVELCGYFYYQSTRTCLIEKDRYLKSEKATLLKKHHHTKTLSSSFIKGFLIEVSHKMEKLYKERQSNIPQEYGLMVIEKTERVKSEFDVLNLKLKTRNTKLKGELTAFNDGKESGKNMILTQGIETNDINVLP